MARKWKLTTVVAVACALVRKGGWVNRPKDDSVPAGQGLWTSDEVRLILTRQQPVPEWFGQKDVDRAHALINDLMNRTNLTGDYEKGDKQLREKVRQWLSEGGVTEEDIGSAARVAIYGRNGVDKRYPAKETWDSLKESTKQGNLREVLTFDPLMPAVVKYVIPMPWRRRLVKVRGEDGNGYQWIEKEVDPLRKGDTLYLVQGKVKDWPVFEGVTWTEFSEGTCVVTRTPLASTHADALR